METTARKSKIRKDDSVYVIAGNAKGQSGKVLRVLGDRIIVQGVNMRKKHVKPTQGSKGGIVTMERSVHVSNVKLSVDGQPVRLKTRVSKDGSRELGFKKGEEWVSYRKLHK
jgi:large subunit ribosomal protein L24